MPRETLERERVSHIAVPWPEGESYLDVVGRTRELLADLLDEWDGHRVLLVGHSANRWALEHLLAERGPRRAGRSAGLRLAARLGVHARKSPLDESSSAGRDFCRKRATWTPAARRGRAGPMWRSHRIRCSFRRARNRADGAPVGWATGHQRRCECGDPKHADINCAAKRPTCTETWDSEKVFGDEVSTSATTSRRCSSTRTRRAPATMSSTSSCCRPIRRPRTRSCAASRTASS